MKKTCLLGAVSACVVGVLLSHTVWASPVTVTRNDGFSDAWDTSSTTDNYSGTSIPFTDSPSATNGNSSSVTNINYSGDPGSITFAYDFTHSIDNTTGDTSFNDIARTYIGFLDFTANNDAIYSIDGFYTMSGPVGTTVYLLAFLKDETVGSFVFRDYSASRNTANESFILGVAGDGDVANVINGNLTGNLISGHDYTFHLVTYISADDGNNPTMVAASASGEVNLIIQSVPIPAAVWLFLTGLIGLIGISRHKNAA